MSFCLFCSTAFSQAKSGVENYNMLSQGSEYVWMPIVHYQAKNGLYGELRYNYEDIQTLSFYAGKTFTGEKSLEFSLTPMLGYSIGRFTGFSVATNAELEWRKIYLSSQTQYSVATKNGISDFFFSWSEIGYNISSTLFGGVAIQYTLQDGLHQADPGFVAGINFRNVSIPLYVFSPFRPGHYFVVGLNYEFDFKKKR